MPKNYFGGRVLVPFEMYMTLRKIFFGPDEIARKYLPGKENENESDY